MKTKQEILEIIRHSIGTEKYHKYSPFPAYPVITDGVKAVAEAAGCYWLLDIIGSCQGRWKKLDPRFQVWKLVVRKDKTASVRAYNDTKHVRSQKVEFTDFPMEELKLYLIDGVILLPNEY
jgi:hypothetical protein